MLTVGHSNRSLQEFLTILKVHQVSLLVDVRSVPKSRYNPHFGQENLSQSLRECLIEYRHMRGLGGLRTPRADSVNTGWKNASFRGYADYMQTDEFQSNLRELLDLDRQYRLVIMCAEAVPWRCHRSLVADAVTVCGVAVHHILSSATPKQHELTRFARVEEGRVFYPAENFDLFTPER